MLFQLLNLLLIFLCSGEEVQIGAIATQGRPAYTEDGGWYVESYTLAYGNDGDNFQNLREYGISKVSSKIDQRPCLLAIPSVPECINGDLFSLFGGLFCPMIFNQIHLRRALCLQNSNFLLYHGILCQ